jgi:predicted carbohydrate-binding protein with CBM5 and CBM33 domain
VTPLILLDFETPTKTLVRVLDSLTGKAHTGHMTRKPDPTAPFADIWDYFYDKARYDPVQPMEKDDAEDYADRMASAYAV